MPTGEEIRDAFKNSAIWLSKNRHMFKDEHNAIAKIKGEDDHIGTLEARVIFEVLKVVLGEVMP